MATKRGRASRVLKKPTSYQIDWPQGGGSDTQSTLNYAILHAAGLSEVTAGADVKITEVEDGQITKSWIISLQLVSE